MHFFLHSFERHGAYDEAVAVVVLCYVHRDGIVLCGQFYFAHIDIFAIGVGVVVRFAPVSNEFLTLPYLESSAGRRLVIAHI